MCTHGTDAYTQTQTQAHRQTDRHTIGVGMYLTLGEEGGYYYYEHPRVCMHFYKQEYLLFYSCYKEIHKHNFIFAITYWNLYLLTNSPN